MVLWGGATKSDPVTEEDGVAVIPGTCLQDWLESIANNGLEDEAMTEAWQRVKAHIARREKDDLERRVATCGHDVLVSADRWSELIGMIGFLAEVAVLRASGAAWFPVVGVGLGSLAWFAHRLGLHRSWPLAWIFGTQAVTFLSSSHTLFRASHGYFTDHGRHATDKVDDRIPLRSRQPRLLSTAASPAPSIPTSTVQPGGPTFHKAPGCKALADGQRSVERRGGSASEIVGVHVGVAISSGLAPCLRCIPNFKGRANG